MKTLKCKKLKVMKKHISIKYTHTLSKYINVLYLKGNFINLFIQFTNLIRFNKDRGKLIIKGSFKESYSYEDITKK